ncbi:MAG: hypothetical protein JNK09_17770 [Prolixibacteraceae bacterium]|nr:hypothetical protein [Prolixibacteraceae bacterium]
MRKVVKRIIWAVLALVFIVIVVAGIAIWLVFTPDRITPLVRTQADRYLTCESQIGEVELTFFSTFPKFGIKVSNFALINHFKGATSDTLLRADRMVGIVDLVAWWTHNELVLNELRMHNGTMNAYVDSLEHANFKVFKSDTVTAPENSETAFRFIDLKNLVLDNVNVSYIDKAMKFQTDVRQLTAQLSGKMIADTMQLQINAEKAIVSLEYDGEKFLREAQVRTKTNARFILPKMRIEFDPSEATVNNMNASFSGAIENQPTQVLFDLDYEGKLLPLPEILAFVPSEYQSYLKGVEANGLVTSEGKITGAYSDSLMPLMDLHIVLQDGTLKYEGFPVALSQMNGEVSFYSDLTNDDISYLNITRFSAKTPKSSVQTSGKITHFLTDAHCDLTSEGDLESSEFGPMIPASMKTKLNGRVAGKVVSQFSMSQFEKMQLEKMNFSGSLKLTDIKAVYDTISVQADDSKVDFALPNLQPSAKNRQFVRANVNVGSLQIGTPKSILATAKNGFVSLEASDVRDTLRVPDVVCTFRLDSLSARMDTVQVAVRKPSGNLELKARKGKPTEPEVNVTFDSGRLLASAGTANGWMDNAKLKAYYLSDPLQPRIKLEYLGNSMKLAMGADSARFDRIDLSADLLNDQAKKDIFQQWRGTGFVKVDKGFVALSALKSALEIPSIQMDFTPEIFNIKESRLKIDQSDFSLSGKLNNVLSYFRNDSLLRGTFNFVSDKTDLVQLMQLTSGMGEKKPVEAKPAIAEEMPTGPYMVPKGMDVQLNVDVASANYGTGVARDIKGQVRVKDGLLILDNMNFTTPAAKMRLTTMYRTPRRNHLFMGLDFHMTEVEIAELLKMIPDVDTIMPMLRSFSGKGEFHMAVETNLDSLYNPKPSTIRGAASIRGTDLVLMDGETFSEIAKTLKFSKKTFNKVDSLAAEFTIFKREIDIYPFLIVMDKYKGVVAGRHNMDMSFDYHISVVDSPLPIKLGIDITGTLDDLKYRLAKCRYAEMYRPAARGEVQNRQMELRRLIRDALTQKLAEPPTP